MDDERRPPDERYRTEARESGQPQDYVRASFWLAYRSHLSCRTIGNMAFVTWLADRQKINEGGT